MSTNAGKKFNLKAEGFGLSVEASYEKVEEKTFKYGCKWGCER
jgi:hypothetical protein